MTVAASHSVAFPKSTSRRTALAVAGLAWSISLGVALGWALGVATPVQAQAAYPAQNIKFIVPYPAGGATDTLARMMAQKFQESWGQGVVVDNKPGAGGTIGNNLVAKATPDGYTVLVGITAVIQQPPLMANLPYDIFKDFVPITRIAISPSLFAVPPASPANSVKDFAAIVKANPGKYNYGSYGAGTSSHIQGALLNLQSGLDLVHVPFAGAAPLINNMLGGQLTSAFIDLGSARAHLKSFKILAVTGTKRLPALPDVPTLAEQGFHSFEPYGWFGFFMPAGTPAAVVNKFSEEANRILALPDVVARIEGMSLWVGGGKPDEFAATMKSDAAVYAKIIKDGNIKLNQ